MMETCGARCLESGGLRFRHAADRRKPDDESSVCHASIQSNLFTALLESTMRHVSWLLRCLSVVGLFASISMPAGNVRAADVQDELQQRQVQLTNALKKYVRRASVSPMEWVLEVA